MTMSIIEEIAPGMMSLIQNKHMRIVREQREQSFGNAVVEIESSEFDLRVVRDRGQVAFEISPSGKADWHSLENILKFISEGTESVDSKAVAKNFKKIAALMTSDLSKVGFLAFEKQQSESFLKRLFPS